MLEVPTAERLACLPCHAAPQLTPSFPLRASPVRSNQTTDATDPFSMPPHGTEVFISKLPHEASDTQIKAFCEQCGDVFATRIPKDRNSNQNKG